MAHALSGEEWDKVTAALAKLPVPPRARVTHDDVTGGALIFLLANAALLPLAAPFVLIADPNVAQHVSNGLALALLFATGARLARYTGTSPLWEGLRFMASGAALVAITIALGMRRTRAALLLALACLSAGSFALAQSGPGTGAPNAQLAGDAVRPRS